MLKTKLRFALVLEQILSACHFTSIGLYFLFFTTTSTGVIFSDLNSVQSLCFFHSQPYLHASTDSGKHTHSPTQNCPKHGRNLMGPTMAMADVSLRFGCLPLKIFCPFVISQLSLVPHFCHYGIQTPVKHGWNSEGWVGFLPRYELQKTATVKLVTQICHRPTWWLNHTHPKATKMETRGKIWEEMADWATPMFLTLRSW